jgi:hypothetical protein
MIAPSGQGKQTEAEPQPASKINARKREYEDEDDGPTAKRRTAPASRARSTVHDGKSYCRATKKQTNHIPRRSTHNQPRRPGRIHNRVWPLSKLTGRRSARRRQVKLTASYYLTKLSQQIYDTNGILRKYLAKLHFAVDPDSLPPLVAREDQHMSHDALQEDVDFSQGTFESPLLGQIQDGAGTGCQTITSDAVKPLHLMRTNFCHRTAILKPPRMDGPATLTSHYCNA